MRINSSLIGVVLPILLVVVAVTVTVLILGKPKAKNTVAISGAEFSIKNPVEAPEITGIESWINSNGESLKNLRGKVVLIDFWTYSCINCIRSLPHVTGWYEKYKDQGFVVIGVHAPEFAFEHEKANVQKAVKEYKINYPVALDNNLATWGAFKNQYWPAEYFIDKAGKLRHTHFGEGKYSESEAVIQTLLKENGKDVAAGAIDKSQDTPPGTPGQSPETYLGYERGANFANVSEFKADSVVNYNLAEVELNNWSLGGAWSVGAKDTVAGSDNSKLRYDFTAKEVYLVMSGEGQTVTMTLNGRAVTATSMGGKDVAADGKVHLDGARLYKLIKSDKVINGGVLDITFSSGVKINAFTFGG